MGRAHHVCLWADLSNVPADLVDGDDDLYGSCSSGQILLKSAASGGCAADNGLTESEVEASQTNAPIDLASGSMVGGDAIITTATDQDSFWAD